MEQAAKQEWKNILTMAHNNGFPEHIIYKLRNKLLAKKDGTTQTQAMEQHNRKWVTFAYHKNLIMSTPAEYTSSNATHGIKPT